jgi:hypothetical protein
VRGRRWLIAGLILNLGLAASNAVFLLEPKKEQRGDFVQLYTAWSLVREGAGPRLYDYRLQAERQRSLLGGWTFPGGLLPFNYPPHVGLAFAPLAAVPLRPAFLLWSLAQLALLGWLMRILWRLARGPALERWFTCAAVGALPALLLTFVQGAFSLLLLVTVLKLHEALAARRERAAGWWLALGTFKPQLILLPALATLAARRWRAVATFAATMLVVVLVCGAAFGPRTWSDFLAAVARAQGALDAQGVHVSATINLKGALVFAFGPAVHALIPAVSAGGFLLACAATIWIWRGPWRPDDSRLALRLAATLLLGTFLNLHLYPQDGLMIAAAAVLFDRYLRDNARPRLGMAVLAATAPLAWLLGEFVLTPRWIRVPVVLQLVLGAWMARELVGARASGLRRDQPAGASDI